MRLTSILIALTALFSVLTNVQAADLQLVDNHKTQYVIALSPKASAIDRYAAKVLAECLKKMTKADFPLADSATVKPGRHVIYVGKSQPGKLKRQQFVAKNAGSDIYLYGEGKHGALNAVIWFMENQLGWHWYSQFEHQVYPQRASIKLEPFAVSRQLSFNSRELHSRWGKVEFSYLNGVNYGLESGTRIKGKSTPGWLKSEIACDLPIHTLFSYIPPKPNAKYANRLKGLKKRDYFKTNPDFFSMSKNGKRVANRQLCFSNKALRKELTKNVFAHLKQCGSDQYVTIDAADTPDKFCYCEDCEALEKKYKSNGGPLYDYLLEFCAELKKKYPGVKVKTLAYRRSQTQKPPKLPNGKKLPDNLIVNFAPIEDSYFADWNNPDKRIQGTYQDLKDWAKITAPGNLWAWLYPNPYRSGHYMPVGNVERTVTQMKKMYSAGVRGVFVDHNGYLTRSGFSELQAWLIMKLAQDINRDPDALIKEFTDNQFGKAAPIARKYINELEQGRKAMDPLPPNVTYRSTGFTKTLFPYLTGKNIYRWQGYFDEMEKLAAGQPRELLNVQLMRRELDLATLWRWFDLKKAYPKYFTDYNKITKRFELADTAYCPAGYRAKPLNEGIIKDFLTKIKGGGKSKPLPEKFAKIPEDRIRQYLPVNGKAVNDPDAARGYAISVYGPELPFKFGFWQWISKFPEKGKHNARMTLNKADITPGVYKMYSLGRIKVTPDSLMWFSKSWKTNLQLGTRVYEPGEDNTWDAYVSLKFDGPLYGGKGQKNSVVCDRIVLVKQF